MDTLPQDISTLAFKRTNLEYEKEIAFDGKMLRLLLAMREEKDMAQIAAQSGLDPSALRKTLNRLLELGLIEPVGQGMTYLDARFIDGLRLNLAQSLGPMAEFLIEDVVAGMDTTIPEIPVQRAAELISALADELPDEDTRIRFKKAMIDLIPR